MEKDLNIQNILEINPRRNFYGVRKAIEYVMVSGTNENSEPNNGKKLTRSKNLKCHKRNQT